MDNHWLKFEQFTEFKTIADRQYFESTIALPIHYKGKYFGQKFQFFPLLKQKHANFFPVFFLPTSVKIFMASFKLI